MIGSLVHRGAPMLVVSLLLNLGAMHVLTVQRGYLLPEAMLATVQAWLLASGNVIGFAALADAQPPLPALLLLPAALLPAPAHAATAAAISGAVAGATACALLHLILATLGVRPGWRYPAVALVAANPILIVRSAMGAPEVVSAAFMLLSIYLFTLWDRYQADHPTLGLIALISSAFAAGLAPLARYESVAYALIMPALIAYRARRVESGKPDRTLAHIITFIVPVVWLLGTRVGVELLVPDDLSPAIGVRPPTTTHPLPASLPSGSPTAWALLVLGLPGVSLLVVSIRRALQPGRWRTLMAAAAILLLALADIGSASSVWAWIRNDPAAGRWAEEQQIADYVTTNAGTHRVLLDDWDGYRVIFLAGRSSYFLLPGDSGYVAALQEPQGRVDYILVRMPDLRGKGPIEELHPGLYGLGRSWTTMEVDQPGAGWRLYRVLDSDQ